MFKKTVKCLSITLLIPVSLTAASKVTDTVQLPNTDPIATGVSASIECMWPTGYGESPGANVISQLNTFNSAAIAINPTKPSNIVVLQTRDSFIDLSAIFTPRGGDSFVSFTNNGGLDWSLSSPQNSSCVGGTLAQTTAPSQFPISFSSNGTVYIAGFASQTRPVTNPLGFIYVQSSTDGGATWSTPTVVDAPGVMSESYINCVGNSATDCTNTCFLDSPSGSVYADPVTPTTVHISWSRVFFPSTFYGSIWYAQSQNSGADFSAIPAQRIYDISFDQGFINSSYYNSNFPTGTCFLGECYGGTLLSVPTSGKSKSAKSGQTLLNAFIRLYPRIKSYTEGLPVSVDGCPINGSPTIAFDNTGNTTVADHAVIVSTDNGQTWTSTAYTLPQYVLALTHDPRTTGASLIFVADGTLNTPFVVSPTTGRLYVCWQGNNTCVSSDPTVNQFYPLISLSRSTDTGQTWSNAVTVSQTPCIPTSICNNNPEICQAFNPNMVFLPNGMLGIVYNDFRNYKGSPTNPIVPVSTDTWIALFTETSSETGGTTGIGLQFVGEIRLTEETGSFDASVGFPTYIAPTGYTSTLGSLALRGVGTITGLAATAKNSFLAAFTVTNQSSPVLVNTPVSPPNLGTIDTNNRTNVYFAKATP